MDARLLGPQPRESSASKPGSSAVRAGTTLGSLLVRVTSAQSPLFTRIISGSGAFAPLLMAASSAARA